MEIGTSLLPQTTGNLIDAVLLSDGEHQEERLLPRAAELEARRQKSRTGAIQINGAI